jgi:hydroxyethylthiazole kinase-like uncharacterized protein yjeF
MPSPGDDLRADVSVTELTADVLRGWKLPALTGTGKASRGDVHVVGVAAGTPGAAILAGISALRVGTGRITLAVAGSVAPAVAVTVPECGVVGLPQAESGSVLGDAAEALADEVSSSDAVLIGSGLDDPAETADLLRRLAPAMGHDTAVVLDAYALGVLHDIPEVTEKCSGRLVLTPNQQELERLLELDVGDLELEQLPQAVSAAARRFGAVVTCQNVIAGPETPVWQCGPNCIGLGTSGSGDVLAGAVLGLLGRGAEPAQAACWATYLHLNAGHRLAGRIGTVGFLARELTDELPVQLEELHR